MIIFYSFVSSFCNFRNCYLESDVDYFAICREKVIQSLSDKETGFYAKRDNYFAK